MKNKQLNALGAFEDLELFDSKGNRVYNFNAGSKGDWAKSTYDSKGNRLTYKNSNGYWRKYTYNSDGNLLTVEDSKGYWSKSTYNSDGYLITYEDSMGVKTGFDIPEHTMENKETPEEASERLYPIKNTGSMFMPNRDEVNNIYKQEGFMEGAKWVIEQIKQQDNEK